MYLDHLLQEYLDDLASEKPTPGGGSTAALNGAMSAALVSMVARLTLGKADYAAVQPEIETIIEKAEQLRTRLLILMQKDIEYYGRLSASFKLPRTTDEEKAERTKAIQDNLVSAAYIPLSMTERVVELMPHFLRIAEIGNKNALSDIAVAAELALAAGHAASWMVQVNLRSLKDRAKADEFQTRLQEALATIAAGREQIINTIK